MKIYSISPSNSNNKVSLKPQSFKWLPKSAEEINLIRSLPKKTRHFYAKLLAFFTPNGRDNRIARYIRDLIQAHELKTARKLGQAQTSIIA